MISDGIADKNAGPREMDEVLVVTTTVVVVVDGPSANTLSHSSDVRGVPTSSPDTFTETSHVVYITAFPPSNTVSPQPVLPKLDRQALSDGPVLAYAIPVSLGVGVVLGIVVTALVRAWWRNHRHDRGCNLGC